MNHRLFGSTLIALVPVLLAGVALADEKTSAEATASTEVKKTCRTIQTPNGPGGKPGAARTESFWQTYGAVAFNDFGGIEQKAYSVVGSFTDCSDSPKLEAWTYSLSVAFDDVDTEGLRTTAGRLTAGAIYWLPARMTKKDMVELSSQWGFGANLSVGYEDYYKAGPVLGAIEKDQRLSSIVEGVGVYSIANNGESGFPPSLGSFSVEGRVAWVDKRAPSDDAPAFATEAFGMASGSAAITYFVNHRGNGSLAEFRLIRQHVFSDTLVKDINRARVQWRPQRPLQAPGATDKFALGLTYSWGDADYSGVMLDLSKAF